VDYRYNRLRVLLIVHCVQFVSVMSSIPLSFWGEMFSSSDECTSQCDSYTFSTITWSVSFLFLQPYY